MSLDLSECRLPRLPQHLSCLTELRVLYLHACFAAEGAPPVPQMQQEFATALGPLRKLLMLSISGNALRELPAAVAALPRLKALHLEGNAELRLTAGPYLESLEELNIDYPTLFGSHALLSSAAALSTLFLSGAHTVGSDAASAEAVARSLAACPCLRTLHDYLPDGRVTSLSAGVAQLLLLLPTACPVLYATVGDDDVTAYDLHTFPVAWRDW